MNSGLTGQSVRELVDAYMHATGRPWTQPNRLRITRCPEVAIDILKRAKNLDDSASLLEAAKVTHYNSVVGPLKSSTAWSSHDGAFATSTVT
jgi:hypothetical protein